MALLTGNIEHFTFSIPGVSQELKVASFTGSEKVSAPFRYFIELACKDAELDFDSCIGKPALLTLIGDHDNIERYVHGIVQHMHHLRHAQQFTLYKLELVAQLDFLKLRQNSRIYQNTTVPDIIQNVFKDANISADHFKLSLNATYEAREYCVQYRETDLQFVARLMQEEGIYYYFEHSKDAHLLIITDSANTSKAIGEPSTVAFHTGTGTVDAEDAVRVFTYSEQVQSGAVTLRDFNFKKPALGLQAQKQASQFTNLEVYDYPGGYDAPAGGTKYSQVRLEALQAAADQGQGESNCLRLLPGFRMTLAEHPRKKMNQEYLLTEMTCSARQPQVLEDVAGGEGTSYNNNFRCIPSSVPFRAPHDIKKPRIDGVQTAIVTGPAGEEIYVDEHGRVKVQFHWDRDGQNDEKSSCWIRVSQLWAGAGWGAMFIPRIAQEVVVDFIEGDPDRPIITGRVFHGTNRPPYKLPDDKTKSTIKSDSTKGGGGSNEWRFEDLKDKEEVYLHGQKDWNIRVENDTKEWIGHDRHLMLLHDQYERVDGDKHQKVNGDHNIKIDGTLSIDVGADLQQKTAQHYAHEAGNEIHLKAGQKVVIEAGAELSLKAGGSFVKLDGSGVTLLGAQLKLNQGGSAGSGAGLSLKAPKSPLEVVKGAVTARAAQQSSTALETAAPVAKIVVEDPSHTLESSYAYDQLKGLVKFQSENEFLTWLVTIFGVELPLDAYRAFRQDVVNGALAQPKIKVVKHGAGAHAGAYDNDSKEIRVSAQLLKNAVQDPVARAKLFVVLNHEFGHHVDNLLRTQYSSVGKDAKGEEGSRFAYNLARLKFDTQSQAQYATYTSTEFGSGTLVVEYAEANRIAQQYAADDQHDEQQGTIEMFPAGRGQCTGDGGCYGHESIEDVLREIKVLRPFSEDERNLIYFGNWLRDNSQLIDAKFVRPKGSKDQTLGFSRQTLTAVVQVLAEDKFGNKSEFKVTEERLGLYRPEEHLDNPKGIEDGRSKDPAFRGAYVAKEGEIDANGFKNYFRSYSPEPTAWKYLTDQLSKAVQQGRTPEGMRLFGQALHVFEDFFAHSNFCEITLYKLKHRDVKLWVPDNYKSGRIPLVTGTFDGADTKASLLLEVGETLQQAKTKFSGELTSQQRIALILLRDRYPTWEKSFRTLAEFQKTIEKNTPESLLKLYDQTYGAFNRYLDSIMGGHLMKRAEAIKQEQNKTRDPDSTDPTHTQIAKDHPTHPLHLLAAELARYAVGELGIVMAKAWDNQVNLTAVIQVADRHWTHPQTATWMDNMVSQWAKAYAVKVKQASSREYLDEQAHKHELAFEQQMQRAFPQYAKASGHIDELMEG